METNAVTGQGRKTLPAKSEDTVPCLNTDSVVQVESKASDSPRAGFSESERELYGIAVLFMGIALLCQLKHLWEMLTGKEDATWSEPGVPLSILLGACFGFCGGCITGGRYILRVFRKKA